MKDAVSRFIKTENSLISEEIRIFLKDLQDLVFKASDGIDIYREMLSDYYNLYNSILNNRNNDIFRFLTIFSTVFILLLLLPVYTEPILNISRNLNTGTATLYSLPAWQLLHQLWFLFLKGKNGFDRDFYLIFVLHPGP